MTGCPDRLSPWLKITLEIRVYSRLKQGSRYNRVPSHTLGIRTKSQMNFLLSAGEASGDTYGAQLIESLRRLASSSTFFGMGGEKMRAAGCNLQVHANEVAVV